jgi:multidrug resistance efflux pump
MTIADLSTVWVTANVPEKDTSLIAKGQPVDVAFVAYPEHGAKGEVLLSATFSTRTRVAPRFVSPSRTKICA